MAKTSWTMTAIPLALMLGLAGCNGGDDEEGAPAAEESGQSTQSSQASGEDTGSSERTSRDETAPTGNGDAANTAAGSESIGDAPAQTGTTGEPDAAATDDSWDDTQDDVEDALKETERRFKEAEREINEQFEQAQQQDVKEQQAIEMDEPSSAGGSGSGSN